jgi:hypothetical protein
LYAYDINCSIEDSTSLALRDLRNVDNPGVRETVAGGILPEYMPFSVQSQQCKVVCDLLAGVEVALL